MIQSIGANIRARRRALGLNQQELAAKLGLTQANISRIESNPRGPCGEMLLSLARALSCDVRELLGVKDAVGDSFQDLDEEAKTFLVRTMKSDPQFGMNLRGFVRDSDDLAKEDWKFLAVNLKLALRYAAEAIRGKRSRNG